MKSNLYKAPLFFLLLFIAFPIQAQYRKYYSDYIDKYKDLAVEQMSKYGIPASITLAQGLFESGAGMSDLAKCSNNHFGIKCPGGWNGKRTYHDDDAPKECFREYNNAKDSYEDHSLFLTRGSRYRFLFDLDKTDYRGWANGLKKAGYATDPSYANRLISIIEEYQLYKYDGDFWHHKRHKINKEDIVVYKHQVRLANDLVYVRAYAGDSFDGLSKEFGVSARKIARYNDLQEDYNIQPGDIIYLHKKQKRAAKNCIFHVVSAGESMHLVSQMYGIRLKSLYKMNDKDPDYVPMVGDILRLR